MLALGLLLRWARSGRNTDVADDASKFAEHTAPGVGLAGGATIGFATGTTAPPNPPVALLVAMA